jgi:hypothetical protein
LPAQKSQFFSLYWLRGISVPKKSINGGSTNSFPLPSTDQTGGDKVSACLTDSSSSQLYCPLEHLKRRDKGREFTTLFFRKVASSVIIEHKMVVASSQVYFSSTVEF